MIQVIATERNTYYLTNKGQMYLCGANTDSQCANVEEKVDSSDSEVEETENDKFKELYKMIEKMDHQDMI